MLAGIEAERDCHRSMLWMFPLPHARLLGSGREPLRPTRLVRARSLFSALALVAATPSGMLAMSQCGSSLDSRPIANTVGL